MADICPADTPHHDQVLAEFEVDRAKTLADLEHAEEAHRRVEGLSNG